jgi:hypothetical protein
VGHEERQEMRESHENTNLDYANEPAEDDARAVRNRLRREVAAVGAAVGAARHGASPIQLHDYQRHDHHHRVHRSWRVGDHSRQDSRHDQWLAGLPTALWTPQVQTGDASFGVRTNQFGFTINWASGMTVVVEASTDLANPTWTALATNTLTSGSAYFSDPQWTSYPNRFYRLRWP